MSGCIGPNSITVLSQSLNKYIKKNSDPEKIDFILKLYPDRCLIVIIGHQKLWLSIQEYDGWKFIALVTLWRCAIKEESKTYRFTLQQWQQ